MKFLSAFMLTALLSFAVGLFTILPWFSFVFCAVAVAVTVHQKPFKAFIAGFLALFILWGALAAILDIANEHILSVKVAQILPLQGSSLVLVLLTAFMGGLVAGFGALTGSYLRKAK